MAAEDVNAYVRENDARLITSYLDAFPELAALSLEERKKILLATKLTSSSKPQVEKVGHDLYIPANMVGDPSVYNDVRVSKNQRIASSLEGLLPRLKDTTFWTSTLPPAIYGIRYYWIVFHRDFVNQESWETRSEHIELLVPIEALKQLVL